MIMVFLVTWGGLVGVFAKIKAYIAQIGSTGVSWAKPIRQPMFVIRKIVFDHNWVNEMGSRAFGVFQCKHV